jgi:uncharacterized membrane protein
MSLAPLFNASPVIQLHALCATLALALGAVQLFRRKGDPVHRAIGYAWVTLMAIVALSSFFIWTIRMVGPFSPIHLVSIFVLVMLWLGVRHARAHEIERHRRTMQYTYAIGLVITGLLTFFPGRIMYHVAFGDAATPGKIAVFALAVIAVAIVVGAVLRWRHTPAGRAFVARH